MIGSDASLNEAPASSCRRISVSAYASAGTGARRLRRSEGPGHGLVRRSKKRSAGYAAASHRSWYDRGRDGCATSPAGRPAYLPGRGGAASPVPELRQGEAGAAGVAGRHRVLHQAVRLLRRPALPGDDDPGCRQGTAPGLEDVKALDKQYMAEQLRRAGTPGPKAMGIDEVSIRKGHTYRIMVSDLVRRRAIWFGGTDRSEASMDQFCQWLGAEKPGHSAGRDGHVEALSQLHHRSTRRRPASCSTSSMSCAIWARSWTRCARPNTPG